MKHERKRDPDDCPQCGDPDCDRWGRCAPYPPGDDTDYRFLLRRSVQLHKERKAAQ